MLAVSGLDAGQMSHNRDTMHARYSTHARDG
jgi:hypothetical protein